MAVLGVAWWMISPLFIDKEVDEQLDGKVETAIEFALEQAGKGVEKAGEAMQDADVGSIKDAVQGSVKKFTEKDSSNLAEQLPDEDMRKLFEEKMEEMTDVSMAEEMPEVADEPAVLALGSFDSIAHEGSGDVSVINLGDNQGRIVRFTDFNVLNGPDLRVILSKNSNVASTEGLGDYIELGKLKGNIGNQNYALPANLDISEYKSVVIYCKPFHVVFNSANIK